MNCQAIRITQRKYNILCIAYGGAKKKLTGFNQFPKLHSE